MLATERGHYSTVALLTESLADIEAVNDNGTNSLMLAAYCGNLAISEFLVGKGAKINVRDGNGEDAMIQAAKRPAG